ncbi:patatin-like phospholipase family protein [Shewanella inventionis]|uniref:Patatin n=1 Tax=Shewanella inventionis TaxID=1738770 RepID=A0ABQ1JB10_9GAMM|nr:patatin-like phospholipase family protein [Shewanella inventionis]MCL1158019.1 patatin-like phospholipase family protein [Shewanella inventionis]UAL44040.1 patatin-like phospholipase family protein [Shewanella inventionis]GGB62976.1 patatin [Shewanella inventionis]
MQAILRLNQLGCFLLSFICFSVVIQPAIAAPKTVKERPTIGLVLSGGGAKGTAHIGVLKVLEKHNIPVDYIAGTSIGAYVAGMSALGYSADQIEKIMLNGQWAKGYSDTIPRESLSYRDKQQRDQFNIPLTVGYNNNSLTSPSGLLRGQTMSLLLRHSTDLVEQFGDFDDLAIPYRAVATDLATSEAVVLSSGSVVQAMQASATVPGALQPAIIDGRLLVDGGIANNMPVDVVKAMGADIVIAVDIGSPLVGQDRLDSTVAVLEQLSTMLTQASTARQKTLLTERDILIRPAIDVLSTTDFSIMPLALKLGEDAANIQLEKLKKLSIKEPAYLAYQADKKQQSLRWIDPLKKPIYKIAFNNQSKVSEKLLRERLGINKGDVLTKEELAAALKRVYALNKFERVDAEFEDVEQGRIITVTTRAKSWGPNYFQAGFNWEDDFSLDSAITLSLAYTMTDLTQMGGEWRNEVELGYRKLVASEFYQPLDRDQTFYSLARVQYQMRSWDLLDQDSSYLLLENNAAQLELGIGYNYDSDGLIELGFIGEDGQVKSEVDSQDSINYHSTGAYLKLTYDTLNSISFPTEGNRFTFTSYLRDESYSGVTSSDNPFGDDLAWQFEADWKGALQLGNHAIVGKVELATTQNDGSFTLHVAELGGFLNLSGYRKDTLVGAHKIFSAVIYQYDLGRDVLITDLPLYLGVSLEGGNVWFERSEMELDDLIYASSLYLGTDTDWGPAALGLGVTDRGDKAFYLFLGKNF